MAAVVSVHNFLLFTKNVTSFIPEISAANAEGTVALPLLTVIPLSGNVICTVGGVLSGVGVGVRVGVGFFVGVGVLVGLGVSVGVFVGVKVGVSVGVGVSVVGVSVSEGVTVRVGLSPTGDVRGGVNGSSALCCKVCTRCTCTISNAEAAIKTTSPTSLPVRVERNCENHKRKREELLSTYLD